MEGAVIAERKQKKFEGFALNEPFSGNIIDYQMGKIRLSGHRAQGGEFWSSEAHAIKRVELRVCDPLKFSLVWGQGNRGIAAQLSKIRIFRFIRHYHAPVKVVSQPFNRFRPLVVSNG